MTKIFIYFFIHFCNPNIWSRSYYQVVPTRYTLTTENVETDRECGKSKKKKKTHYLLYAKRANKYVYENTC